MSDRERLRRLSVERGLAKADADLHATTLVLRGGGEPWIAAFHAQQPAEKSMQALLVSGQVHFPKTHDLAVLRSLLGKLDQRLEKELESVDALTLYAVLDRYPSAEPDRERTITTSGAEAAIDLASEDRKTILSRILPSTEPAP